MGAPLAYMRGRTLDEAVMIWDEAQNTTHGHRGDEDVVSYPQSGSAQKS